MAVRSIKPVTGTLPFPLLEALRSRGLVIDEPRLEKALHGDPNARPAPQPKLIGRGTPVDCKGLGHYEFNIVSYDVRVNLADPALVDCTCPDWSNWGKTQTPPVCCKHILTLACEASPQWEAAQGTVPAAPSRPVAPPAPPPAVPFSEKVYNAVSLAVAKLAARVWAAWQEGEMPLLLGPTDSAKSGTFEYLAETHDLRFFPDTGMESKADADLVGMLTVEGPLPKFLDDAFKYAREQLAKPLAEQKPGIICIDEMYRYNQRALDVLMGPLARPKSGKLARLMNIPCDEPVRVIDVPVWPRIWAPARLLYIGLAANPWGASPDPALIRRVKPIRVGFDPEVLKLFDPNIALAVQVTWDGNAADTVRLPLGYSTLEKAKGPKDLSIFEEYFARLEVLDPTGPEGLKQLFTTKGIKF